MRAARFVLVGGLCALLNNVAVVYLVHWRLGTVLASIVAFGPVLAIGYGLHLRFTFDREPSWGSFLRYLLATATNFPLWVAGLYLLHDLAGLAIAVAAPVTTLLIFLWNYLAARWAFLGRRGGEARTPAGPAPEASPWR